MQKSLVKPAWLKIKLKKSPGFEKIQEMKNNTKIATVCQSAHCPNITECWNSGTATFMILGEVCTRGCRFCAVKTASKGEIVDKNEPKKLLDTIKKMNLDYVVITTVDRDDLPDQGATHMAKCVSVIQDSGIKVEILGPDFRGHDNLIKILADSKPTVFAHNIESVKRLQELVRDPRANYEQSLHVLKKAKEYGCKKTKSSIIVGFGETKKEVIETMNDLRSVGVNFLTIGQYLQPSENHYPLQEYITPEVFKFYKEKALAAGFEYCASGPLIRSSYKAGDYFKVAEKK